MRAKDLYENKGSTADTPWKSRETLPPSMSIPDMDPYYEYYRFLTSIAGFPDEYHKKIIDQDVPVVVPYTPIEHKLAVEMLHKMGKHPKFLTKKNSVEPDGTYTKSPVRPFKDLD